MSETKKMIIVSAGLFGPAIIGALIHLYVIARRGIGSRNYRPYEDAALWFLWPAIAGFFILAALPMLIMRLGERAHDKDQAKKRPTRPGSFGE